METGIDIPSMVPSGKGTTYDIMGHQVSVKLHSSDTNDLFIILTLGFKNPRL